MKLEENKSLKTDLKKLKDELASTKKSEDGCPVTPRSSTIHLCPHGSSIISTLHVKAQELHGNKHIALRTFTPKYNQTSSWLENLSDSNRPWRSPNSYWACFSSAH